MAKMCVNHASEAAVTHCYQCHKPLCKSCLMVTPHGSFCSSECNIIYKEFKERYKGEGKRKSSVMAKIFAFFLLLIAAIIAIHVVAEYGKVKALAGVDIIGKLLNAAEKAPTPKSPEGGK
ncbi:MAG: hypothetical protein A2Z34_11095 [Planctomycetes bacterium RBG_16_59_8]|nr:MAG: hypothetical protein A2Z34_11095 [Planctomycetes bacterium RBG_16_59_8]